MCGKQFITHIIVVAAEDLWHLGSLFYYNTQYSQRGWFTNSLWCDNPQNSAPQRGPYHIWCIYTPCLFLAVTSRQTAVHLCGWFRWPLFVMAVESQTIFCTHSWSSSNLGVGWSRAFPASSIYKCVSKSSRTVLVNRSMVTLDVKFLHHLQSTPLLHEYSGPIISALLGSIPGSPFLE